MLCWTSCWYMVSKSVLNFCWNTSFNKEFHSDSCLVFRQRARSGILIFYGSAIKGNWFLLSIRMYNKNKTIKSPIMSRVKNPLSGAVSGWRKVSLCATASLCLWEVKYNLLCKLFIPDTQQNSVQNLGWYRNFLNKFF